MKNITLVGASGSLGSVILSKLLETGRFNVQVLRRPTSSAAFPAAVKVVDVLLSAVEDVKAALEGQDALISALGISQVQDQANLTDACIAAGVQRFIPAEFGADVENEKVQTLPVYAPIVKVRNHLIERSRDTSLTYTFVHNGGFLDWGLQHDFLLKVSDYQPMLIDGGSRLFSATTVSSIADAVVGILDHPQETKNRAVYIEDCKITQNTLYQLAKEVAPLKPWAPIHVKLDDLTADADRRVAEGTADRDVMVPYLYRALMDPECGGNFREVDNGLLGLKQFTEEDLRNIVREHVK
ncbi:hypothetical protein B0I35DRAFT_483867 [Stachybotrys elegans]|uniref:NAD(P)-binding domain-containing protein n=1 Tax=Stachybotrys elegans TaxID=80388 RepID=A0A8K0SGC2_9HYPO|nr:hypothetical protein B0I35DRAFT_483867 [Stachybotrys elegans]